MPRVCPKSGVRKSVSVWCYPDRRGIYIDLGPRKQVSDWVCRLHWDLTCMTGLPAAQIDPTRPLASKGNARWRQLFKQRRVVMYWMRIVTEVQYAPGGAGRKRDCEAFESDMAELNGSAQ